MTDADPKKPTEDKAAADAAAAPASAPVDAAAATLEGDDLFDEFGKKRDNRLETIDHLLHPSSHFFVLSLSLARARAWSALLMSPIMVLRGKERRMHRVLARRWEESARNDEKSWLARNPSLLFFCLLFQSIALCFFFLSTPTSDLDLFPHFRNKLS